MKEISFIEKTPAIKRGWIRALLLLIAYIIGITIFGVITTVIISVVTGTNLMDIEALMTNPDNLWIRFVMQFVSLIVTFIVIWIFRKYIDRKSIMSMGFQFKGKNIDVVFGLFLGFLLMFLGFGILKLTNNLEVISISYNTKVVFGGFFFFLIVAIIEEIIFRAYVLNNLMDTFKNKYVALIISAIMFALFHGMNPNLSLMGFVNLIVAGGALGVTYIHTKNIWFPVFLHLSWNFFQGPIFGFEVSGLYFNSVIQQNVIGNDLITGGKFGFEGSIIITILLLGMIIITDRILVKKTI
ncbi:MAG: type II CAAX endopeptidase family protein [Bacteroidales bacterium]|jgi:membrane protease YdiL (CAAX protease family)|nr:type II CAAX endopeptidase family protein [Bacteroidales bacterium]